MGSAATPENVSTDFSLMVIGSFLLFRSETRIARQPFILVTVHRASHPRPCRRHPSRRHRASQRSGSARWSDRSRGGVSPVRDHVRSGHRVSQQKDGNHCTFAYSALASFRMGMSGASFQRAKKSVAKVDSRFSLAQRRPYGQ
jgi:hypothetical protein